jgi:hypothetical protein
VASTRAYREEHRLPTHSRWLRTQSGMQRIDEQCHS